MVAQVKTSKKAKAKAGIAKDPAITKLLSMTPAEVSKYIGVVKSMKQRYESTLHRTACACIVQVMEHRNCDLSSKLIEAIDKGSTRRNSLIKWFMIKAPVKWGKVGESDAFKMAESDSAQWMEMKALYDKDKEGFIADLIKRPFWELDPEPQFDGFNLMAALETLREKARLYSEGKKNKKGDLLTEEEKAKINLVGLVPLERTIAMIHAPTTTVN